MDPIANMASSFDSGRRELLRGGAALVVGLLLGVPVDLRGIANSWGSASPGVSGEPGPSATQHAGDAAPAGSSTSLLPRSLTFFNTHTSERIDSVYWCDGAFCPPGLREIDHLLRDHRTGEVKEIDHGLLDLLHDLHAKTGASQPFHVISGYRSAATNALLQSESHGVATRSLHIQGRAIDIRIPGLPLGKLRDAAVRLGRGGVGYYPASDFVHVDVGSPRTW
jgi:uncharacterized protein YcbK (DUF882 family)